MLSGNDSIAHYSKGNVFLWMLMSFQAGTLNAAGFLACQRFVSHVTGLATYFGIEMAQESYLRAMGMLAVPGFFLLGAMISGQMVDIPLRSKKKPRYYIPFGLIFAFILFLLVAGISGAFGEFGQPLERRHYLLLATLCLVCGMQNGTVSTVSRSVIRTTHLTGITTDLGLGLVRVLNTSLLPRIHSEEFRANFMRVGIIFFFALGSMAGAAAFLRFAFEGFLLPTVTSGALFFTFLYFQVIKKAPDPIVDNTG